MPRKTAAKSNKSKTSDKTDTANKRPAGLRKLPRAYQLFIQAVKVPARHWEVFGGILLIYTVLNITLIGGLTGGDDLLALKDSLTDAFTGQFSKVSTGLALFGFLVTNGANSAASGVAGAYLTFLLLLTSLALIWALRQVYAGNKIRVRDTFYNGMQPLVQFMIVSAVVALQLVPAVIGGFFFSVLVGGGILQQLHEVIIASGILFLLLASSVYMLCSSLFAFYIVTLPDMTPLSALRSAKHIVRYRRGVVLLKLLFLPLALVVVASLFMVPISLLLTQAATFVFFIISILAVVVVHSYMYALYRELIVEQ